MRKWTIIPLAAILLLSASCATSSNEPSPARAPTVGDETSGHQEPLVKRLFRPYLEAEWIGNGISYGPYRDGQRPGGVHPTRDELRADLHLLSQHWHLLRMYGSRGPAATVLEIIRTDKLPLKVMLGAWIDTEVRYAEDGTVAEAYPETVAANRDEVQTAIHLANQYADVVIAVNIGNETQVDWSFHPVPADLLIRYLRQARAGTTAPVTTADDFSYWKEPESKPIAREVDFIVMHVYGMWWGQRLDTALAFTQAKYAEVTAMHPEHTVVIGEAGWATRKRAEGEQARLIAGIAGEEQQRIFYEQFIAWTTRERIANFYFEAFDENWKGGDHPDEVEKHWGLFRADRTLKAALGGRKQP